MFSSRSPSRGGFSAEDLILGTQGDSRKVRLEKTEQLQESRKKEKIVKTDHFKPLISQEAHGLWRRNRYRVAIEGALRHDVARAGIPGIVFPEGEQPARPETTPDVIQGRSSFPCRDVMEDAVAIDDVHVSLRNKIMKGEELTAGRSIPEARALKRTEGYVEPDDKIQIECVAEKSRGVAYPAAVIDRGAGQHVQLLERAFQPVDPFEGKIILVFAADGQSLVQFGIVRVGVLVELRSGTHQVIAPNFLIQQLPHIAAKGLDEPFFEENQSWLLMEEAKVSSLRT